MSSASCRKEIYSNGYSQEGGSQGRAEEGCSRQEGGSSRKEEGWEEVGTTFVDERLFVYGIGLVDPETGPGTADRSLGMS